MSVDLIVLNGGSSSGKSSLASELKPRLEGTWVSLGIDDLIRAMSYGPSDGSAGESMVFLPGGTIEVAPKFHPAQTAWYAGIAAIARTGIGVIMDEVFLDGGMSQHALLESLVGLEVAWIGVRCDAEIAEARERLRGDRNPGMARQQADRVHLGTTYDVVVDTSDLSTGQCADVIMGWVSRS